MSPLARGVYRELLDAHYGEADCSLPDDDLHLAAIAGVTLKEWSKVKDEVMRYLPSCAPGRVRNERAYQGWLAKKDYREWCRAGGKARAESQTPEDRSALAKRAADARWASRKQESSTNGHTGAASQMLGDARSPSSQMLGDAKIRIRSGSGSDTKKEDPPLPPQRGGAELPPSKSSKRRKRDRSGLGPAELQRMADEAEGSAG